MFLAGELTFVVNKLFAISRFHHTASILQRSTMLWLYVLVLCGMALARSPEENRGGRYFEGDIILTGEQRRVIGRGRFKRAAQIARNWPKGVMIYAIDGALARNSRAMQAIRQGMQEWSSKTCVRFQKRKREGAYAYFKSGSGCSSFVGRIGRRQDITLAPGCWTRGIVAHEIGHALGFWHEQSRPDRDRFVKILFQNIIPGTEHNFRKLGTNVINTGGFPYDYASVMHYGPKFFTKNGKPTIQVLRKGVSIGNRRGISAEDRNQMQRKYLPECRKRG